MNVMKVCKINEVEYNDDAWVWWSCMIEMYECDNDDV